MRTGGLPFLVTLEEAGGEQRRVYTLAWKVSVCAGKKCFCVEEILFLSSALTT
jgi:hypothetical protein